MSQEIYNCLDCQICIENLEYENFNCDINNIFKNLSVDSGFRNIDYYKTLMYFSGCPKAFYIQNYDIVNFIENQLTFNFKECETFVHDFAVKVYIQDRNIQENAERLKYMQKIGVNNG